MGKGQNKHFKKGRENKTKPIFQCPTEGQIVCKVIGKLGNLHFFVEDIDGKRYNSKLKSGIAKFTSIRIDNYVLIENYLNCSEIVHQYQREDTNELLQRRLIKRIILDENREVDFQFDYNKTEAEEDEIENQEYRGDLDDFMKSSENDDSSSDESDIDIDNL